MKPLRLEFSALGPFPGSESIDFGRLGRDGLFLISGPTGAGKTTILDALVFALYGKVPGARAGHLGRLRTDFPSDLPTRVALEFEAAGQTWRVERQPTQTVTKRRGSGTREQSAQASLARREGGVWTTLETRTGAVDERTEELLGLEAEQFQQVILLPQGQFERVLRANTNDRRTLLRTLFRTDVYERAVQILHAERSRRETEAEEAEQAVAEQQERCLDAWQAIALQAGPDLARGAGIALDAYDEPHPPTPFDLEALDTMVEQAEKVLRKLKTEAKKATEMAEKARLRQQELEQRRSDWKRRQELLKEAEVLERRKEEDLELEKRLDAADRAAEVLPILKHHEEAASTRSRQQSAVERLRDDLAGALAAVPESPPLPATASECRRLVEEMEGKARGRQEAADWFAEATGKREVAAARREEGAALVARLKASRVEAESLEQRLLSLRQELSTRRSETATLSPMEDNLRTAEDRLAQWRKGTELDVKIAGGEQEQAKQEARLTAATQQLEQLRVAHRNGLAARLAIDLTPGSPCPTCGATEHPQPATGGLETPSEDDLTAAEKDVEVERIAAEARGRELAGLRGQREALPAAAEGDSLHFLVTEARLKVEAARAAEADVTRLVEEEKRQEQRRKSLEAEREGLERDQREKEKEAVALESGAAELETRARERTPDPERAGSEVARYSRAAREGRQLADALEEAAKGEANLQLLSEQLRETLKRKDFADAEAARQARLEDEERIEGRRGLGERRDRRVAVAEGLRSFESREWPENEPDAEEARIEAEARQAEARRTTDRHAEAKVHQRALTSAPAELRSLLEAQKHRREAAEEAGTVHETASGRQAPRVSLETWVCAAYLERVTQQANHFLIDMTSGQYRLQIGTGGSTDGRKQGGLDLEILDAFTGRARPVATLSGGETFLASLALALGLSQVVAGASNLHLEALFIDEGFGSLDPEALDRAMTELRKLQDQGRLVGAISHVEQMKRELPSGIEVQRSDRGSTLRVNYPDAL